MFYVILLSIEYVARTFNFQEFTKNLLLMLRKIFVIFLKFKSSNNINFE